jgi:hypothetical protein
MTEKYYLRQSYNCAVIFKTIDRRQEDSGMNEYQQAFLEFCLQIISSRIQLLLFIPDIWTLKHFLRIC